VPFPAPGGPMRRISIAMLLPCEGRKDKRTWD
jgi:hypothetical protein